MTTIRCLIVENVEDDKGNCRIPSRSICILTREKAEPSGGKKKKGGREREHAMFEQCLRGAAVLICACEEGGGREGSGPLSGRKGQISVMELSSPSILIKNT